MSVRDYDVSQPSLLARLIGSESRALWREVSVPGPRTTPRFDALLYAGSTLLLIEAKQRAAQIRTATSQVQQALDSLQPLLTEALGHALALQPVVLLATGRAGRPEESDGVPVLQLSEHQDRLKVPNLVRTVHEPAGLPTVEEVDAIVGPLSQTSDPSELYSLSGEIARSWFASKHSGATLTDAHIAVIERHFRGRRWTLRAELHPESLRPGRATFEVESDLSDDDWARLLDAQSDLIGQETLLSEQLGIEDPLNRVGLVLVPDHSAPEAASHTTTS